MRVLKTNEAKLGFIGKVANAKASDIELIRMFQANKPDEKLEVDVSLNHRIVDYECHQYYLFENGNETYIYKKLPLIKDDKDFKWDFRKTYNCRNPLMQDFHFACLEYGKVSYHCHYYELSERCIIDVHMWQVGKRNIRKIYVDNATNEKIMRAIKEHLSELKSIVDNANIEFGLSAV